jgi:TrmH family RNA methyltransferase
MGMRINRLSVTLVEPQYAINVGHVARLLGNFGISKLYLVQPRIDLNVALIYAGKGANVLRRAERVSLQEVRKRHQLLVATTAIRARSKGNVVRAVSQPETTLGLIRSASSTNLVMGRDTTGLTNKELALCDMVLSIDTGTKYRTLNVSHALGIILYLISRSEQREATLLPLAMRERIAQYAQELAMACMLPKHKSIRLKALMKRVVLKLNLTEREASLLISLYRKALVTIKSISNSEERVN